MGYYDVCECAQQWWAELGEADGGGEGGLGEGGEVGADWIGGGGDHRGYTWGEADGVAGCAVGGVGGEGGAVEGAVEGAGGSKCGIRDVGCDMRDAVCWKWGCGMGIGICCICGETQFAVSLISACLRVGLASYLGGFVYNWVQGECARVIPCSMGFRVPNAKTLQSVHRYFL